MSAVATVPALVLYFPVILLLVSAMSGQVLALAISVSTGPKARRPPVMMEMPAPMAMFAMAQGHAQRGGRPCAQIYDRTASFIKGAIRLRGACIKIGVARASFVMKVSAALRYRCRQAQVYAALRREAARR